MARTSPTVRRKRLGSELLRLREAAGCNGEEVAEHMKWGASSKVYRIEKGEIGVRIGDLTSLLDFYGVTDTELRDGLRVLAREGRKRGWWAPYNDVTNRNFATYIGLESAATELRSYEALVFHGLVQTEQYARALLAATAPEPATSVDRKVQLRMDRQKRLAEPDPVRLTMVVDESVLLRRVGGREVMRDQLRRLRDLVLAERVTLRVLRLETGANPGMVSSFTHIHFADPLDPDCVYLESLSGDIFVEGEELVADYTRAFDVIHSCATTGDASLALLDTAIEANDRPHR